MSHRKTRTRDVNNEDARVHELVDIIAEEVSDVDRAANRRRYLAIKRETEGDEDGLGPEIFDDELVDEGTDSDPDDTSLTKARRSRAADDKESEDDENSEDTEDEGLFEEDESEDTEDEEESEDEDADEVDRRRPRRRKARKETRVLSAKAKVALLRRTAPVLERLTKLVASIKDAAESQEGGAQGIPDWITRELQWICDALAQLLGQPSKPVNKLGAKMASQRREQLKGAVELLQRLLQEVMPEITAARAPAANPPRPAPTAKAAKREPDTHGELGALFASMTEGISALTAQVKSQASELARLKKSTGLPASRPVESVRRPRPAQPEEDWPLDMNAPLSRDRVAKEVSFFEDT